MKDSIAPDHCPKCGNAIPAEAVQGLCPGCALAAVANATEASQPAGERPPPPSLDTVAAAFPQIEILELIGTGGMGAVYRARQPRLDRMAKMNWDSPHPADGEPAGPTDPEVFVLSVRHSDGRPLALLAEWPAEVSMPLQVFRIGDLAVAAWPREIFAASGLELKRRSPAQPLFNVGLANGWYGYIPPPDQFQYGAYETWRMRTSPLETNAIPKMLDVFLGLLQPNPTTPEH
jgi:hypothetical protein